MQSSDGKIHFSCNECGTKFVATTDQAGKSGKCKNCGSPIAVPFLKEAEESKIVAEEVISTKQKECPNCMKTVSKEDSFCPNCGNSLISKSAQDNEHPKESPIPMKQPLKVFIFLMAAFVMGVIIVNFNADTSRQPKSNRTNYLTARVNFDGLSFTIYNEDSFDWTDTLLEVNGDYKIKHQIIKSHQSLTFHAQNFSQGDGKRFNVYTHKVKDFWIWADTPHGKLSYLGEYNK